MNLFETLKQFKTIEPDAAFKEKSKRAVLAQIPHEAWGVRRIISTIFETAIAGALTVFFILIIVGQFPGQSSVTPVQFSAINPETLRAEAQAVDIQIQLAKIAYEVSTTTAESTPQVAAAIAAKQPAIAAAAAASSTAASEATSTNASSTASSTFSVDQALQELSQ